MTAHMILQLFLVIDVLIIGATSVVAFYHLKEHKNGKHAEPEDLIAAVEAASAGALWIGSGVERPSFAARPGRDQAPLPGGLTARELVVADLLARGLANPAISARLGLSTKTVANYVSAILLKLAATDRADAARIIRAHLGL